MVRPGCIRSKGSLDRLAYILNQVSQVTLLTLLTPLTLLTNVTHVTHFTVVTAPAMHIYEITPTRANELQYLSAYKNGSNLDNAVSYWPNHKMDPILVSEYSY